MGRGGDDLIFATTTDGRDMINGGKGTRDWLVLNAETATVGINLSIAKPGKTDLFAGGSSVIGVERLAFAGGSGADTVTGGALRDELLGNGGADRLFGGRGVDLLDGGAGRDRLTGGAGADDFQFTTALGAGNVDRITDFNRAAGDMISLSADIFTAVPSDGVTAAAFHIGSVATTADQRILYDKASGKLYYDSDGTGADAAVLFAVLDVGTSLRASDFDFLLT